MEGITRGVIARMISKDNYIESEAILNTTSRLQANLNSWADGDITHMYMDMTAMFQELRGEECALTKKQLRVVESAWMSFDKIFNREKNDPYNTFGLAEIISQ